jgi:ATP-dependent helicase/nuclease subunit A
VVDYKTNRPSPDDVRDIPPSYRAQLGLYKELLGQIYPNKIIKTALLWTDKPFFMPL